MINFIVKSEVNCHYCILRVGYEIKVLEIILAFRGFENFTFYHNVSFLCLSVLIPSQSLF